MVFGYGGSLGRMYSKFNCKVYNKCWNKQANYVKTIRKCVESENN